MAELPIEQQRENNFWHISDYLIGELIHLDKSLEGKNIQDLIAKRKVDIFDSLEGLAKKILDKKTIYGVSIINNNTVYTYYIDVDSDLSGTSFITHVHHRVVKMLGSEDFATISIFKIP